ncbi:hypothetical protein RRG08_012971 [Elysia crispata]|uniref:Uncharacterized protein n=1 Tax=Elysia crispata TaxID=231223 RepID=A0AAE1A0I5_9GAST|nr:hypothetical protein RRG08_012971 [Elysia crispata]
MESVLTVCAAHSRPGDQDKRGFITSTISRFFWFLSTARLMLQYDDDEQCHFFVLQQLNSAWPLITHMCERLGFLTDEARAMSTKRPIFPASRYRSSHQLRRREIWTSRGTIRAGLKASGLSPFLMIMTREDVDDRETKHQGKQVALIIVSDETHVRREQWRRKTGLTFMGSNNNYNERASPLCVSPSARVYETCGVEMSERFSLRGFYYTVMGFAVGADRLRE